MAEHEGSVSRERIIAEATRLFVAFGYHRISMREIAEATGISKAGLYYHFRDKEELILEILHSNLVEIFSLSRRAYSRLPQLPTPATTLVCPVGRASKRYSI